MKPILTSLTLLLSACMSVMPSASAAPPSSYSAEPTFGTVVDDATGKPIEGAFVVAQWVLEYSGSVDGGVLVVRETVTDAFGNFRIEGWGPIHRPHKGLLDLLDPEVLIFKPRWSSTGDSNWGLASPGSRIGLSKREWLRNGGTMRLRGVTSTTSAREEKLRMIRIRNALSRVLESPDCKWTYIPKAISTLEKELARTGGPSAAVSGVPFISRMTAGH